MTDNEFGEDLFSIIDRDCDRDRGCDGIGDSLLFFFLLLVILFCSCGGFSRC